MLHLSVASQQQNENYDHATGLLELGRAAPPDGDSPRRIILTDSYVSRNQVRMEERPPGRLWLQNLSGRREIEFPNHALYQSNAQVPIGPGEHREVTLPILLRIGKTEVSIWSNEQDQLEKESLSVVTEHASSPSTQIPKESLLELGETPSPAKLTSWLETIINLGSEGADVNGFYERAARALVDLIGLDAGMVILRTGDAWKVQAGYGVDDSVSMRYSRTLVTLVFEEQRTYFKELDQELLQTESLSSVDTYVASPIFGVEENVVGVLYGARVKTNRGRFGISSLEASVVKLLASQVSAILARSTALRTRVQFEQFFSADLVSQLQHNPDLLEPRNQAVTILCSDLRGFTRLSERLGAEVTCQLIQDMMERLSDHIIETGGAIVDYAGDGILAMWNAPVSQPDHAHLACEAALRMKAEMPGLNDRWRERVGAELRLGIGINTGDAQVGNIGSHRRFKYGPHGHTVNMASRVQNATKQFDAEILITDATRQLVMDSFQSKSAGDAALDGVEDQVALFELTANAETPEADELKEELLATHPGFVEIETIDDVTVGAILTDRIEAEHLNELKGLLDYVEKDQITKMILDMAQLKYAHQDAVIAFYRLHQRVCLKKGKLLICRLNSTMINIFAASLLDNVFEIVATKEEAFELLK